MSGWIVETAIATTLLMVLVLAIRRPVARQFGPGIAYALWSLPVLRMLMPPLPGEWQLSRLIAPLTREVDGAPGVAIGLLDPDRLPPHVAEAALGNATMDVGGHHAAVAAVPPVEVAGGPDIVTLLLGIWALGAVIFLAYHLIAHSRFCARLLDNARVTRLVAEGRVHVVETDAATGPLAFGIWRKYVAFPRDFNERYDPLERNLALAHELGHHARGDLVANWVALVMLALHWFNPVAWRAFRAFRADQEMACDALVLSGRAPALRHAYGCAIVKSAHGGAVSAACHLHTVNELKGRLKMLSKHDRKSRGRRTLGIFAASGIAASALIGTASGSEANATIERAGGNAATIVSATTSTAPYAVQAVEAPAAPAAPALPARPLAPAVPDAPAAPAADPLKSDGNSIRRVRIIRTNGDASDIDVPEVTSLDCKSGDPAGMTYTTTRNGRNVTVICRNRIEVAASDAARAGVDAKRIQQDAMRSALASLAGARASVASAEMSAQDRAEAMAGIDEAQREMEDELRKAD